MPPRDDELIRQATEARDAAERERAQAQAKLGEKKRELRDARRMLGEAWKKEGRADSTLHRADGTMAFGFQAIAVLLGVTLLFPAAFATFSADDGDTMTEAISFDSIQPARNCPGTYVASYSVLSHHSDPSYEERQTRTRLVNDTILTERIRAAILRDAPLTVTERYHGRTTFLGAFAENYCSGWYVGKASLPTKQGA